MRFIYLSLCFLILVLFYTSTVKAQEAQFFIAVREDCVNEPAASALYALDPITGLSVPLGSIGFLGVTALEFLPDGRMIGSAAQDTDIRSAVLLEINPRTGAGSLIGTIGENVPGECSRAPDLSVHPITGQLYATGDQCEGGDFLQSVNPVTGAGSLIGTYAPFDGGGNALAISQDGIFFVTTCCETDRDTSELLIVDPNTGSPTDLGLLDVGEDYIVNAMAYNPVDGELYGTVVNFGGNENPNNRKSIFVRINTDSVTAEKIADLPDCTDGLAIRIKQTTGIPTLSEWGLIAMAGILGILGLMVLRRKKTTA